MAIPKATEETDLHLLPSNREFLNFAYFVLHFISDQTQRERERERERESGTKSGDYRKMRLPQAVEALSARAASIRESLQKNQTITRTTWSPFSVPSTTASPPSKPPCVPLKFDSFEHIRYGGRNVILGKFDLTPKAEVKILRGPHEDLESYLEAIDRRRSIVCFFSSNRSFKSRGGILNQTNTLLAKAISKLED
ncbi:hypothetical protein I3843_09G020000 [Carya illinoinensis]|nr:hypothetical protein I3843_09G020000 [Carya illinoinensis]